MSVGSHVKVLGRPDIAVSPGISGLEAGGVQDGVHRRGPGLGHAEIASLQPGRARDGPEAEQVPG